MRPFTETDTRFAGHVWRRFAVKGGKTVWSTDVPNAGGIKNAYVEADAESEKYILTMYPEKKGKIAIECDSRRDLKRAITDSDMMQKAKTLKDSKKGVLDALLGRLR